MFLKRLVDVIPCKGREWYRSSSLRPRLCKLVRGTRPCVSRGSAHGIPGAPTARRGGLAGSVGQSQGGCPQSGV